MTIKKTVIGRGLPRIHPGLEQKLREAEDAEKKGKRVRTYDGVQRVTRPSLDASTEERAWQARTIGLIDPQYKLENDALQPLAEQAAFRPGQDLDKIWDELGEAEKIRAGAIERFRLEMESVLRRAGREYKEPHRIGGRLDARNLKRSAENVSAEVATFAEVLAPDSYSLLLRFVEETRAVLDSAMRQQAVQGVDAVFTYELVRDMARKLVYQELVSRRRGMGDRGIRRIIANIQLGESLYGQLVPQGLATVRHRIMMRIIHVHQDLGHTAYAARVSFRGGRLHRAYGARIFTDETNRLRPLLTPTELDLVRAAVATHSSEELPFAQEMVLALVRVADHLAPFAPHRVYKHLEGIAGVTDYLDDMLARARAGDGPRYAAIRSSLRRYLAENTELPETLRDDIIADFRPIDRGADFIEIGPMAGEVSGITIEPRANGSAGRVLAQVTYDAFSHRYQGLFDHQQDQLTRLARTTRVDLAKAREQVRFMVSGHGSLDLEFVMPPEPVESGAA